MTFTIYVDEQRWRAHQQRVHEDFTGLVPVVKGNGYGLGNSRLAGAASELGVDTITVGTEREVADVVPAFAGDVLVLTPVHATTTYDNNPRVLRTVAAVDLVETVAPDTRIVIECRTSMNRHGIRPTELTDLARVLRERHFEGFALHLPLDRSHTDAAGETTGWLERLASAGLPTRQLWVSHLREAELAALRARFPATTFRPRIGTQLWLGDRDALTARGTVLDVEPLARGQRSGYRQNPAPAKGFLVVVSGGTAHGVSLESPRSVRGLVPRAKVLALGTLEAVGRNLSPFTWSGKQRWFLEPPHMQVSLIFVPHGVAPPAVGEELACQVRLTTTHPDRVLPS